MRLSFSIAVLAMAAPTTMAGATLYGISFSNSLYTINTSTGATTLVGPLDSNMAAFDLAGYNGSLYAYDQVASVLRGIDPATGHTVATIAIGATGAVGEGALAIDSSGSGVLAPAAGNFYSFQLAPGSATAISSGITPTIDGLAFNSSGTLYAFTQQGTDATNISRLATVNRLTGALTFIGSTGITDEILGGLAFASDGTLYLDATNQAQTMSSLYSINPATGAARLIGTNTANISGLAFFAPVSAVPEPATVTLIGGGLLAAWIARRKR